MSSQSVDQSSGKMGQSENHLVPNTPAKSTCTRPTSHSYDEFSILLNEIATNGSSFVDPELAALNTMTKPLPSYVDVNVEFMSSCGISTPAKSVTMRPTVLSQLEIVTEEGAGFDLNAPPSATLPIFHNSVPAPKGKKRKVEEQDNIATPEKGPKKKKKKVYWPKVKGQIKRRSTPKVAKESKTNKRTPVSAVDGGATAKPKRTPKSVPANKSKNCASNADEGKFDMSCCELPPNVDKHEVQVKLLSSSEVLEQRTSLRRSKRESCKRSLVFELEEESPHNESGCKANSVQIYRKRKRQPQKRINLRCTQLTRLKTMKLPKACSGKRTARQRPHSPFQLFTKRGKRSFNGKRRIRFDGLVMLPGVEEGKTEKHGMEEQRGRLMSEWKTKGKRSKSRKKRMNVEKWEIREGTKALHIHTRTNFGKYPSDEDNGVEDEVERKKNRRSTKTKVKTISSVEMKILINRIRSLDINYSNNELVPYKNPDGTLVPYRGTKDGQRIKVKIDIDPETLRVWNLLMRGKSPHQIEENGEYWERERSVYLGRVNAFIARMHNFLGNRSFSPWKGSVLDSVIGVFLTQNVSDHLSSSAYMSLASVFPIKKSSEERKDNLVMLKIENSSEDRTTNNDSNLPNSRLYSSPGMVFGKKKSYSTSKKQGDQIDQERLKKEEQEAEEKDKQYWESLRRIYVQYCTPQSDHSDSVDWEAVRCAEVSKVAKAIEGRGQHNIIARRIQAFLNKLVEMHGTTDLEWLRYAPPNEVKEYLLKVYGLGLKSVECIRLLALKHKAFPVDVNVGRIAVRLGWVPLEPLPESIQMHLLDQYPIIDMVQQYLWPRVCNLDQPTLYQLHYHLITFGKVFCTKKQPNCNACPMRAECKHFASAFASAKLALPGPVTDGRPDNSVVRSEVPDKFLKSQLLNDTSTTNTKEYEARLDNSVAKSEVPACFESRFLNGPSTSNTTQYEPIVEYPASPSPEIEINDMEDFYKSDDDSEEFITVKLNEERTKIADKYFDRKHMENSKAMVPLTPSNASIPMPKLKNVSRLRTERLVYVLPDAHPLLAGFKMREPGDPSNYLLVIWTSGELKDPCESTQNQCCNSNNDGFCCNNIEEENDQTVPGTVLIPCRTAMDGRFPLNGTYFQVNEVFADADSSKHPINVPRRWIWNLPTRIAYFGTSTSTISRGLSLEAVQECFAGGFVCVRGFDRKMAAPRPLSYRFHRSTADKQVRKKNTEK